MHFAITNAVPFRLPLMRRSFDTAPIETDWIHSKATAYHLDYTGKQKETFFTDDAAYPSLPRAKRTRLQNFGNVQYIGSVGFGYPPQYLDMIFDTGSSDTWIPGVNCGSDGSHHQFDMQKSSTCRDTDEKFYDVVSGLLLFCFSLQTSSYSDSIVSCDAVWKRLSVRHSGSRFS